MATMAADAIFIDTNVLVYAAIESAPLHSTALRAMKRHSAPEAPSWVSRQIIREYLCVLTRPQSFSPPLPAAIVAKQARHIAQRFRVAEDSPRVTERLLALLGQFSIGGKRIHDANIVATMLTREIPALLTHNTKDFEVFAGLITILPLEDEEQR